MSIPAPSSQSQYLTASVSSNDEKKESVGARHDEKKENVRAFGVSDDAVSDYCREIIVGIRGKSFGE